MMLISFLHQLRPLKAAALVWKQLQPLAGAGVCRALGLQGRELGGGSPAPRLKLLVLLSAWKNPTQNLKKLFNKTCLPSQG